MVRRSLPIRYAAFSLLAHTGTTFAHGHGDHGESAVDLEASMRAVSTSVSSAMASATAAMSSAPVAQTYFTYSGLSGLMLAHVGLMTVAWFFVLPIGAT